MNAIAFGNELLPPRFWAKVAVQSNGCWEWTAYRNNQGYGQYSQDGCVRSAHRVAHEVLIGPVPNGLDVMHSCDNRPCVNPAHLSAGTRSTNMQDCVDRGRNPYRSQQQCAKGHPFDEANTYWTPDGRRSCRTCMSESDRRRRQDASRREYMREYHRNRKAGA